MNRNDRKGEPEQPVPQTTYHSWLGLAAAALGAILYGLAFVQPVGVYGIIGGIVCELAALGFFRTQKKRRPLKWCRAANVAAYVLFGLGLAFMTGGIIAASLQGS